MHHIQDRPEHGIVAQPRHLFLHLCLQHVQDGASVRQRFRLLLHVADRVRFDSVVCGSLSQDIQKLVVRRVRPNGMYDWETKLALGQVLAKTLVNGVH